MVTAKESKPKFTDIVVIYPCRVVAFDKVEAADIPFGGEIRVETSDAEELISLKRAVLKGNFDPNVHKMPQNKLRGGQAPESKVPASKPYDKMNVAELKAAAEAKGIEVPDGATKREIIALLE